MKRVIVMAVGVLLGLLIWIVTASSRDSSTVSKLEIQERKSKTAPVARTSIPAERSPLADALNSPAADIRADLRLVAGIVDTFRSNFPRDGNPVGDNADITATLTGRNKLRLSLIPPDHPAINAKGELCDRWGTPFFFHAESATQMEIRSAGPDRKMWSADDVVHSP